MRARVLEETTGQTGPTRPTRMVSPHGAGAATMRGVHRVHFVGIGGAGMSAIAELLQSEGYAVSGSDQVRSDATDRLAGRGATVRIGHDAAAVEGADVVVVSSAVDDANAEIVAARRAEVPVVARAEMLGELMRHRHGIAVAGTHGKTTTASLIAKLFLSGGLDPTFVIGAPVGSDEGNARLGRGRHLIAEADESDASFLHLSPVLAVVTNIDRDHLDAYGQDFDRLLAAFVDFARRLPFFGVLVASADDPHTAGILPSIKKPILTFGFDPRADVRAVDIRGGEGPWTFTALRPDGPDLALSLPLPGRHNIQNALAAIAVASAEGIADEAIVTGLARFRGVGRRFETFECVVDGKEVTLVDDYGHHPTELARVIETVRQVWPRRRLLMVYQPHRYTRTRDLYDDFTAVLSDVDWLLLLEVYAAGEAPINGADGRSLADGIRLRGRIDPLFAPSLEEAVERLREELVERDVVVVQGAGDVGRVAQTLRRGS